MGNFSEWEMGLGPRVSDNRPGGYWLSAVCLLGSLTW